MQVIDRRRVRSSFHARAGDYDRHAVVQKRVLERFTPLLPAGSGIARVLDIGSGTGVLLQQLADRYPMARLTGLDLAPGMAMTARERLAGNDRVDFVTADAEALPLGDACLDLVVSTSTMQWLESLEQAFDEVRRVLRPGGRFCFALFGEQTLFELRASYRAAVAAVGRGAVDRTQRFSSMADVSSALSATGFTRESLVSELEIEIHPDVAHLVRAIRNIGAGNAVQAPGRGLAERRVMLAMMDHYQREYAVEGAIPATYEVIYGVARIGE
ncbi:malonyl-CoA O-methyltransferase [Geobacter argillaceus]|uniref:Malonyl-[acyl-carrier protein] O-methyltransferase n=1 Tax=Geobacter argillaceus TaxID=345631 RepID=A0A562WSM7_9BACT|nr:malonyl-CoA O-methyltransferase [Geobacter argillaceus]